jgi:DNA-binding HxlR family transcriptional regulator
MRSSPVGTQVRPPLDAGEIREPETIPGLLRLLGAGAPCSILLALGDEPLRTKDLITRVPGYAPRTVNRYVSRLAEIGAVRREEQQGVPSKVVHHLTDTCGTDLCGLVDLYAKSALEVLPGGGFVPHSWGSLTLLADLWQTGMYEELTVGPCTATELARVGHGLSFHQVSRRTNLFLVGGLIREANGGSRRRRYELTKEARQATALITGLGQWREQHVLPAGEPGLTVTEAAEVVRAALPLVVLREQVGKQMELTIAGQGGGEGETVWGRVEATGAIAPDVEVVDGADSWGRGRVGDWIQTLLEGEPGRVKLGGSDVALMKAVVRGLHDALWRRRGED